MYRMSHFNRRARGYQLRVPWQLSIAEDGEEFLIYIVIAVAVIAAIAAVIGAILTIGLALLAGVALIGGVIGLFTGLGNFFSVLAEAQRTLKGTALSGTPKPKWLGEPQPAYLMYPFDRGWRVMGYVREHLWTTTQKSSQWWFDQAKVGWASRTDNIVTGYWGKCWATGAWLGGVSQYLSSMLFVSIFFALQAVVLSIWAALAMIPVGLLTAGVWAYAQFYGIFYRCPDCHEAMPIPLFICPGCGAEHSRLWPSAYGVLTHTCDNKGCNTKLATLDWSGRRDLMRVCPSCKHPLNVGIGQATNVHIPIIGGRSAGKTNYIVAATNEFLRAYAEPRQLEVSFTDSGHESMFQARVAQMEHGQELEATRDIVPQAYNLLIKSPRRRAPHIAYIYDAAGEAYSSASNSEQQVYYKYVHGIIFMVDPFSLPTVRANHAAEIERVKMSLRPSTLDAMTAYSNMVRTFEASVGLRPDVLFPHPIAIVVSKVDALHLEDQIGASAAQALMQRDPRLALEEDAISFLVRQFLLDNGLDNFVRTVELQFRNVKYFSSSALGRMPNSASSSPFVPIRVTDPLVWLLGAAHAVDVRAERSAQIDAAQRKQSKMYSGLQAPRYYYWESLHPYDPEETIPHGDSTLSAV